MLNTVGITSCAIRIPCAASHSEESYESRTEDCEHISKRARVGESRKVCIVAVLCPERVSEEIVLRGAGASVIKEQ